MGKIKFLSKNLITKFKRMEPSKVEEEEVTNKGVQEEKVQREVIVKGLPFASTEEEIQDFFNKCGEVVSIKLLR